MPLPLGLCDLLTEPNLDQYVRGQEEYSCISQSGMSRSVVPSELAIKTGTQSTGMEGVCRRRFDLLLGCRLA